MTIPCHGQLFVALLFGSDLGMSVPLLQARMSMVDGFPYKEEVGGSNPSVPTKLRFEIPDRFHFSI